MSSLSTSVNGAGDLVVYVEGNAVALLSLSGGAVSLCRYGTTVAKVSATSPLGREILRHARFPDDASVFLDIGTHCEPASSVTIGDLRALILSESP